MMRSLIFILVMMTTLMCGANPPGEKILIIGDSLSTAYGINQNEGWVSLLTQRLNTTAPNAVVINESISGQTTAAGLAELPKWLALHKPSIMILELGGNDGLQGLPIAQLENNLQQMITLAKQSSAKVLLLGMQLPPNYGMRYTEQFKEVYLTLAKNNKINLVPFFLEGVGGYTQYMQYDGVHPGAQAQLIMLDNVWPKLQEML
jgi:acyl-CoA thioesterase I